MGMRKAWMRGVFVMLATLLVCAPAAARLKQGDVPPDLLGLDKDGKEIRVSALRGKVVIVTFWASWCGYCKKALPVLENIQRAAGKAQLEVVVVDHKEPKRDFTRIRRQLRDLQSTLTHDPDGALGDAFGVNGVPHTVLIDRAGAVAYVHGGYSDDVGALMIEDLNELLAESPPAL